MLYISILAADRPDCSPYLARPCRPLHVALRDVADARGIGIMEAVRLVVPPQITGMWIDEATEITESAWDDLHDGNVVWLGDRR